MVNCSDSDDGEVPVYSLHNGEPYFEINDIGVITANNCKYTKITCGKIACWYPGTILSSDIFLILQLDILKRRQKGAVSLCI